MPDKRPSLWLGCEKHTALGLLVMSASRPERFGQQIIVLKPHVVKVICNVDNAILQAVYFEGPLNVENTDRIMRLRCLSSDAYAWALRKRAAIARLPVLLGLVFRRLSQREQDSCRMGPLRSGQLFTEKECQKGACPAEENSYPKRQTIPSASKLE